MLAVAALAAAVAVLALLGAAEADAGQPSSGKCRGSSGPRCQFQYGRVLSVDDGDTILVDVSGDGTSSGKKVRFNGLNAMELHHYSETPADWTGECHGVAAAKLVYDRLQGAGWRVRLAAQHLSSRSGPRLRRAVFYRSGSGWRDLQADVLSAGLALFDGNGKEWAWNRKYSTLSQRAALGRVGLFDTSSCGSGPAEGTPLTVYVKWDADGVDSRHPNGEWARIRNGGASPLRLGGWHFRDSTYRGTYARGYRFPAGATIPAHGEITLYAGCGTRTPKKFYWCQGGSVWENAEGGPRYSGDGGYLFDPQGDLRAWMTYPCFASCADPLDGKVRITAARAKEREYVDLKNVSSRPISLEGSLLAQNPASYAFRRGDRLAPGERLRLWMTHGTAGARVVRSWRLSAHQLTDRGDRVVLMTYRGRRLSCRAWGSYRC